MLRRLLTTLFVVVVVAGFAQVASAQYMYLDSNANGVHDAGDQMQANGTPTTVDIWLDTNSNRNGSDAICNDGGSPLDMLSYVFWLRVQNGTATYAGFVNQQVNFTTNFGVVNTGNGLYKNGFGGALSALLPPGLHRLATVQVTGTGGTPNLIITDNGPGSADITSFGGNCLGNDFDNTYKLIGPSGVGTDWTDVDGLAAAPGAVNNPPVLGAIGNRTVAELVALAFTATATDPDAGQTRSFTLDAGNPAGSTINASTGAFSWTPTEAQGPGAFPITVRVTDNGAPARNDFEAITVTVTEVNVAPVVTSPGNRTLAEMTGLNFAVSATDADIPGSTISWSLDAGAPAGAIIDAGTGSFSWTPTEVQGPGTFPVTIRATDSGAPPLSGTAAITISVTEANLAPVLGVIGNRTVQVSTLLAFTATATDADLPANTRTFSLDAGAPAGSTINATTGAFAWTPGASGTFPVTVRVTDNGVPPLNDFEAITITVNSGANQAPVLGAIGNRTVAELATLAFTATATDPNAGQTLTFSLDAGAPAGSAINGTTGAFSWTPTEAQGPGSFPITVRVTDNGSPALNDFELITVTVTEANVAPVVASPGNRTVAELATLAFTATATDADLPANAITWSLDAGAPAGATIGAATGAFSWTPTEAQGPGNFPPTIRATDNGTPALSGTAAITITVTEVNVAPVLAAIGNKTVQVSTLLTFTATATDADLPANTLSFSLDAGAPAGAVVGAATGVFTWTPAATGSFPVTVRVTDNGTPALNGFELITITVGGAPNQAPVLGAIGNRTVAELATLAFTATATDPNAGQTLTFSLDAGNPAGSAINATTGAFSWTPTEAQGPGSFPIAVRVTDNGGPALDDFEAITVTVTEVNVAPVLAVIGNRTVAELATLAFTATATDADLPANTATFTLGAGNPAGSAINATTGAFSWTPTEAQGPGSFPITVIVTDNGTPVLNDTELITVTVTEVNVAPVLGAIGNRTVAELATLAFTATATDADLPANTLTFSLDAGAPAGATIGGASGAFSWTPTEAQSGSFPITVRVTDNGTPTLNDFEAITVTVTEVNVAPVVTNPGNQAVNELTTLAFTATASDADLPANTLAWSLDAGAPAGATIAAATGAFSWTPTEAQGPGTFPVTIRATDNGTPALSGSAAITITVNEVNVAPVLGVIGNRTVQVSTLLTFTATATDADLPANTVAFSLDAGAPAGAAINATTGAFSWTPAGTGTFSATVRATDNGTPPLNDFEAITITVTAAPNQAPVLGAIGNRTVAELATLAFTATATDPNAGDVQAFSLDAGAPAGAAINATTGAFSWTPTEAQGPGSFPITVRVTDNGTPALNDFELITVTVTEVNVAPVLGAIGNRTVAELAALAFTATATDADLPANTLSFSLGAGNPAGSAINATTGAFSWTPTEAQGPGSFPITVVVTDNGTPALNDTEAITVTVTEVNVAPVLAAIGNRTVAELATLAFTATASDADLPANALTFTLGAGNPAGSAINATTGAFSWTPTEAQGPGSFPITVVVTDNGTPALNDTELITVTVTEVNVAPVVTNPGNQAVNELSALAFTATATDADLPANTLSWSRSGAAAGATIGAGTGAYSWTPTEAQGPGSFPDTIRATDNGTPALSGTAAITITVNEANQAPVLAAIGNRTIQVSTLLAFTATATDADLPANTLSFSLDAGAPAGATIGAATGAFSWTPGGTGSFPVTVRATDNGTPPLNDFEAITITVTAAPNQAPVLGAIGNRTVAELATLAFTATATDPNAGDVQVFSLDAGNPAGSTINATTGAFSWTPTEAQGPGSFPITVRVTDNGTPALNDFELITVTVTEVNVAPVLGAIGNRTVAELAALAFTATASDADLPANTRSFSLGAGNPAGSAINATTGAFSWTPTEAQGPGSFPITVVVTDNGTPALNDTEAITVTVTEVNVAPVLAAIGNRTVAELATLAFTATATDGDLPANTLSFTLGAGNPAGSAINATTGAFSWTPTEAQGPGPFPITVVVTDNGTPALNDTEAITVTVTEVNVAPVLGAVGNKSGTVGTPITFTATATDADLPANTLAFSLDAGAPAGATIGAATGAFSWTPSANGSFPVTVRVTDNGSPALNDFEAITITVSPAPNSPPVLGVIGNRTVAELATLAFTATATDPDAGQTRTFSLDAGNPAGSTINATTGAFSWTPTEAQGPGSFPITVRVTDNGTGPLSDTEAITVTVTEVNVAPVVTSPGNRTVAELAALAFTVTATDADLPANALAWSLDAGAPAGATINSGGAFTWTPTEAQGPGSFPVTIRATDNGTPALSGTAAITVTVTEVNAAPVLGAIGNRTVAELVALTFTATATDADLPANTVAFTLGAGNPAGSAINATTGAFSWTPTEAQGPGSFPITVVVTDNGTPALNDTEAITVTVTEVNVAPVVVSPGNRTVAELVALTFTVTASDADLPANTISWSLDAGAPAGAAINGAGAFSWTPTEAQGPGSFPFTIRATDNGTPALSGTAAITVTVTEGNVAPVLGAIGNKAGTVGVAVTFTATATDADLPANTVAFSLDAGNPAGSTINATTGAFSWTPGATGSFPVTVRVTDNGTPVLSASEAITITVGAAPNQAPVLGAIGNRTVAELVALTFTATATDPNAGDVLTFSLDAGAPAGATIGGTSGAFSWTPTEAQGPGSFPITVRVTDNGTGSLSDFEAITVSVTEVNVAPVLGAIGNRTVAELATLAFTATATDADLPANTATFSLGAGNPAGSAINATTGAFSFTPTEAQGPGSFPVTVIVTDNGTPALNDTEAITVTVTEGNAAPVLGAIGNRTVAELVALTFTATATDADLPANTVAFTLGAGNPAGSAINATTGAFSWTPTEAQGPGSFPITVVVTDNGTPALSDTEAITVTVTEVNVAPVVVSPGNRTVAELVALTFTVTASDADLPANTISWSLDAGAPAGAAINGAGAFSWTPTEAQGPGSFPVTIRATDNGTPALSGTAAITVTVTEGNVAPVLGAIGNKAGTVGVAVTFTATATDADIPANTVAFSLDAGNPAGSTINATTGAFSWTPGATGSFPVTVRVTDNGTPVLSASEAITITVGAAPNQAPVLGAIGNRTVAELVALTFTATATDPNAGDVLTFSLDAGAPAGATIGGTSGAFSWTPTEAQGPGSLPITVRVTDNGSPTLSDFEAITVSVTEVNVAPVLGAIGNRTVVELATLAFTATAADADIPTNTLTFTLGAGNPAGSAINATTGAFTWTPTEAQGPGSFPITVIVTDNGTPALNDSELITVSVTEANVAPVLAAIGPRTGTVGVAITFTATATDADLPANTLAFSLDAGNPAGSAINATTGAFSWTPAATGSFSATVRVTDNGTPVLSASEAITITVNAAPNQAPVLGAIGNRTVAELATLAFTATVTDPNAGDVLTFSLDAGAPAGATIGGASGAFSWTPTEAQGPGSFPITVRVTDNGSPSLNDFELITVTVTEVNVAPVLAAIGPKTGAVGVAVTFTATATDADLPANSLTFSLDAGAPVGAAINGATGAFSWTPGAAGGFSATVRVADNGTPALDDFEAVAFTINPPPNQAPVLGVIGNKTVAELGTLTFTATATDPNVGDLLTFSLDAGAPAGAAINGATGVFTWTPTTPGGFPVTVRVTDNGVPPLSDSETITVTVQAANRAPVLTQPSDMTVNEGATANQQLTATDPDAGDVLAFNKVSGPAFMTVAASGLVGLTPSSADAGVYPASVRVSDNGVPSLSDTKSFQITVIGANTAPTANAGGPYSGATGRPLQFNGSGSSDPNGDALTFAWNFGDGTTGNGANPLHTYQAVGSFSATLTVCDNGTPQLCDSDVAAVTIIAEVPVSIIMKQNGTVLNAKRDNTNAQRVAIEETLFPYTDLDRASIRISTTYPNSGSVTECAPIASFFKIADLNVNGIQDASVKFPNSCLHDLFEFTPNNASVTIIITGQFLSGGASTPLRGQRVVTVKTAGGGGAVAAMASPNPFNPETAIYYTVPKDGPVTMRVYSVNGRLVRTLKDGEQTLAGTHEVRWNGVDDQGRHMPSGVYFVRTTQRSGSSEETSTFKLAITK